MADQKAMRVRAAEVEFRRALHDWLEHADPDNQYDRDEAVMFDLPGLLDYIERTRVRWAEKTAQPINPEPP